MERMKQGDEARTNANIGQPEKPEPKQQARRW
jgi:hypothetical protein